MWVDQLRKGGRKHFGTVEKTNKVASEETELKKNLENIISLIKTETGRTQNKLTEKR